MGHRTIALANVAVVGVLIACSVPFTGDDCTTLPSEFETQRMAFRSTWFGANHADLTAEGLMEFVSEDVVRELGDENEAMDDPLFHSGLKNTSLYHFDDCQFHEAMATITLRYERVIEALNPDSSDLTRAKQQFARALHAMQDFYAHSNWVESGRDYVAFDGRLPLPELAPGELLDGMLVADRLEDYESNRGAKTRTPSVFKQGVWREILMTGTFAANEDVNRCHRAFEIPHGGTFDDACGEAEEINAYLAKDDPDSPYHQEAVTLAEKQTTQEFCRLVHLMFLEYGDEGREFVLDSWVEDRHEFDEACPSD